MARQHGDPALQLRILGAMLPIIGNDKLLHEIRTIAGEIQAALPADTKQIFEETPVVHAAFRVGRCEMLLSRMTWTQKKREKTKTDQERHSPSILMCLYNVNLG
jgi:hypothetical protein